MCFDAMMNERTRLKTPYEPLDVEENSANSSEIAKQPTSNSNSQRRCVLFVALLLSIGCLVLYRDGYLPYQSLTFNSSDGYRIYDECKPGAFSNQSLLPTMRWKPFTTSDVSFPMYWTHSLDNIHPEVEYVVISQHGNLRNANNYFCGAITALQEIFEIDFENPGDLRSMENIENVWRKREKKMEYTSINLNSYMVIAPQFLIDGDLCWDEVINQITTVKIADGITCGHMIWSSEGWKDGLKAMNDQSSLSPDQRSFYSYDIFNTLIERLSDSKYFPNLKKIVLFGFSAGGQTVLRYAMWPQYKLLNPNVIVKFVVGDLSSYLYLDERRPFTNGSVGFGIPDSTWLQDSWKVNANTGAKWIDSWDNSCENYNDWRYGLHTLQGYYLAQSNSVDNFANAIISAFPSRNIHFLIGMNDSENCQLNTKPFCQDNELATYCQAMLQGENRLDRFRKYRDYLENIFQSHMHKVQYVRDVSHDPVAMLRSADAKCVVFEYCNVFQREKFMADSEEADFWMR